jgi:hypothetical protein
LKFEPKFFHRGNKFIQRILFLLTGQSPWAS